MELFDTHCHLDVADFDPDREQVLARCKQAGIRHIVIPAIAADGWDQLRTLADNDEGLYYALGLHPLFIDSHKEAHLEVLEAGLQSGTAVAVGEIGLDYYVTELDKSKQTRFFEAQLTLAKRFDLPVILHVRKAHDQVLTVLKRIKVKGGIAHAFSGSRQQAEQYIQLGFKLGFGGMITYERSTKLRGLAKDLPIDSIVLETDAPDMTVAAHRGERNSPEYLVDCLNALSEIRAEPETYLAQMTTENAKSIFAIS